MKRNHWWQETKFTFIWKTYNPVNVTIIFTSLTLHFQPCLPIKTAHMIPSNPTLYRTSHMYRTSAYTCPASLVEESSPFFIFILCFPEQPWRGLPDSPWNGHMEYYFFWQFWPTIYHLKWLFYDFVPLMSFFVVVFLSFFFYPVTIFIFLTHDIFFHLFPSFLFQYINRLVFRFLSKFSKMKSLRLQIVHRIWSFGSLLYWKF